MCETACILTCDIPCCLETTFVWGRGPDPDTLAHVAEFLTFHMSDSGGILDKLNPLQEPCPQLTVLTNLCHISTTRRGGAFMRVFLRIGVESHKSAIV